MLPTSLLPDAKYENMMSAFGGSGYNVKTPEALRTALEKCLQDNKPSLINVEINPAAARKPQVIFIAHCLVESISETLYI